MNIPEMTTAPVDLDAPTSSGNRCNPTTRNEKGTTIMTSSTDSTPEQPFEPVELDPPAPEINRWEVLVDRSTVVYHDGDAEKVIPLPRPAWAHQDGDVIGTHLDLCYYTSEFAQVALRYRRGAVEDDVFQPAICLVRAKLSGDGKHFVGLAVREIEKGKWNSTLEVGLSPEEALELADVLRAAVDLHSNGGA